MHAKTTRFGVSLDAELLERFDRHIQRRHSRNRSQALGDLIRQALVEEEWADTHNQVMGTVTVVYDHHVRELTDRLTDLQHRYHDRIISALHVHLDHHNCLEVLVVRGRGADVGDLVLRIRSLRGVKHATLSMTTTGAQLP